MINISSQTIVYSIHNKSDGIIVQGNNSMVLCMSGVVNRLRDKVVAVTFDQMQSYTVDNIYNLYISIYI